jgi:hypothetical protein
MTEKNTRDLENILGRTHLDDFDSYCDKNKDSLLNETDDFSAYIKDLLKIKGMSQQTMFLKADLPERYGYKLLSGEKHTRQRDVILRICYAAELTLSETQRALEKYEMPTLYAKIPRDAMLMIIFGDRPGSIIDVNELLKSKGIDPLRTSGIQD